VPPGSQPARRARQTGRVLVTFDLFSALIDSRTGGSAAFAALAEHRGWDVDPPALYDRWDAANKASQRDLREWVPFAEHCRRALVAACAGLGLAGDPDEDVVRLLDSMAGWPLWPDVTEGLPALARDLPVGILSNVDDAVFARTQVAPLVADERVLTSERLRAYKPDPAIYLRARERAGGVLVHVATSARDVRGAVEAGLRVVRLVRAGHGTDPAGRGPEREVTDLPAAGAAVRRMRDSGDRRARM
jgi:2-haloacid dehalogenase